MARAQHPSLLPPHFPLAGRQSNLFVVPNLRKAPLKLLTKHFQLNAMPALMTLREQTSHNR
jgi:hypothetical protein